MVQSRIVMWVTFAVLTLLFNVSGMGQTLAPFSVTVESYQQHSCKFFAFDAQNNLITNLNQSDMSVTNGSTPLQVTGLTPVVVPAVTPRLSVVVALDVSGSMSAENPSRMNVLKNSVRVFLNMLDTTQHECAITTFDQFAYLNQDFTNSRTDLLSAVNALQPQGGTSYDDAFMSDYGGALKVASRGQFKRVVILFTDGDGLGTRDSIVRFANANNIVVYTIPFRMSAPPILDYIATQTGGMMFGHLYYEATSSQAELTAAFRASLMLALGIEPQKVTWTADRYCYQAWRYATIAVPSRSIPAIGRYYILYSSQIPYVGQSPYSLTYGSVAPGSYLDKTVRLSAPNAQITIGSYTITNSRFTIVDWGGSPPPFAIDSGQSRTITVRYTPTDTTFQYGEIQFESNLCYYPFIGMSGGYQTRYVANKTLSVASPYNGNNYNTCWYTYSNWMGLAANDSIRVEWSWDNGATWSLVQDNFTGNFEQWFRSPKREGTQNKFKISHIKMQNTPVVSLKNGHAGKTKQVVLNPQNNNLAVVCLQPENTYLSTRRAYVINTQTGDTVASLLAPNSKTIQSVAWTSDGNYIITAQNGGGTGQITVWNASTYQVVRTITETVLINDIAVNPAGTRIVAAVGASNNPIKLYNLTTGAVVATMLYHTNQPICVSFSADGTRIASGDAMGRIVIWNASTYARINNMDNPTPCMVNSVSFNPMVIDMVLAAYQCGVSATWSTASAAQIRTFDGSIGAHMYSCYSQDGTRIITCGEKGAGSGLYLGASIIWDASSGATIATFDGANKLNNHTFSASYATYSTNGLYIYTANTYGGVNVWTSSGAHSRQMLVRQARGGVVSADFFPDDLKVVTMGEDGSVAIHSSESLDSVRYMFDANSTASKVNQVKVSPNGMYIAAVTTDLTLTLWNASNGLLITRIPNAGYGPAFHPNSQTVAVVKDSVVTIYNTSNGSVNRTYTVANLVAGRDVAYKFDGLALYIGGGVPNNGMSIIAINTNTWTEINRFGDPNLVGRECMKLSISPGLRLASMYSISAGRSYIVDSTMWLNRTIVDVVHGITKNSGYAVGSLISNNQLRAWRVSDGAAIKTINPHQGFAVNHVGLSNNSSRAIAVSNDGNAWLWDFVATPVQSDSSHSPFTLGTAVLVKRDTINFGQVIRGMIKDTMITDILKNVGSSWTYIYGATVKDFWNRNENEYQIVKKTVGEYFYPGQTRTWELRFAPKHNGQLRGDLIITTMCDTLYIVLLGEAVDPPTQNQVAVIDFGKVEIGTQKDTTVVATIKNMTGFPLAFRSTSIAGPDVIQFTILDGAGSYTLQPNEVRQMKLRFAPTKIGKTSSRIKYDYNWLGTPVYIQLVGEGVGIQRARISEQPITITSPMCSEPIPVDTTISIGSYGTGALVLDSAAIIGNDALNYTVLNTFPDTVPVGSIKSITVRFTPNRAALYNDAKLWLWTKASNKPNGLFEIKLYGKRDSTSLEFDGPEAIMANIRPFASKDTSIVIHNTGTAPISFSTPINLGKFIIQSVTPNPIQGHLDGLVNITFTGGDTSRTYDTLFIAHDGCGAPDTIKLRAYVMSPKPTIVAISSLDVQTTPCSATADTTFIITNGGLLPLVLSSVTVNDTTGQFTILHKPTTIDVGGFDSVVVRFKPTSLAKQSTILTIQSNAQNSDSGYTRIPISGVLNKAEYIFDTTRVDFINIVANTPVTSTITIRNTGTVPLNWNAPITKGLFSITTVNPNPVPVNSSSRAVVRFAGAVSGTIARDTLVLNDVCGKPTQVVVSATVQTNKPMLSAVASVSASVLCKNTIDTFFVVKNLGEDTLFIQSFASTGTSTITSTQIFPRGVAGGKTDTIRISISAPLNGMNTGAVTLQSNSVADSLYTIRFSVNVLRQSYTFSQQQVVFPITKPNTTRIATVGIRNTGTLPLQFTLPKSKGLFTFQSVSKNPIPVNDSAIATIRFAGAPIGIYQDTLLLRDTCNAAYSLPFTVDVNESVPAHLSGTTSVFGTEHCGAVWDTIITITNDGGEPLSVSRLFLRGTNANEFKIDNDTAFSLLADETHDIHVRHLQTPVSGPRSAELVLVTNASNAVNNEISATLAVRKDSSGLAWFIPLLDMGNVDLGKDVTKTVKIMNIGSVPQTIQTPIRGGLFVIDSVVPNPLLPGDTAVAYARSLVVDTAGALFETLKVSDNCNSTHDIVLALYVRGRGLLYADTVTATIGEIARIPIRLSESQYVIQSGVRNITTTVRWNTTLMALKSIPKGTLIETHEDGDYRYCTFTASAIPTADSAIALLECIAALGNDTLTKVEFTEVTTDFGSSDIGTRSGVVYVTGQCTEGGIRLLDRKKVTALRAVYPNPSNGFVTFDISTPERAPISITLVDALGKTVRTLYKGMPAGDEWNYSTLVTDVPNGVYQVVLQTYSDVRTQRLEIIR